MKNYDWKYFDDIEMDNIEYVEQKKAKKQTKRKWREIENFKERQRLNRDLEELSHLNY